MQRLTVAANYVSARGLARLSPSAAKGVTNDELHSAAR